MSLTILLQRARARLKDKWAPAIGTFVVYYLILGAAGSFAGAGLVVSMLVSGPFMLGAAAFSLALARKEDAKLEMIFSGFKHFTSALPTYLLIVIYIVLWSLLLVFPGIIAALSYSMSFYILSDKPSMKASEVLRKSREMMYGYKLRLFYLCFRFFLLSLLCILTAGIGFLWLIPFIHVSLAGFYEEIKLMSLKTDADCKKHPSK